MKIAFALALVAVAACATTVSAGPLWDYVNAPDPTLSWVDTGYTLHTDQWDGYMLNLTSQSWLTENATDRHIWTHQLMVFIPSNCKNLSISAIYVTGGGNNNPGNPGVLDEDVLFGAVMAVETGMVTATLWQVPNEPIVFAADPTQKQRSEDAAVAFTWLEFILQKQEPDYIIFMPMVKSVASAMTAVTEYAAKTHGVDIKNFIIAGASKRGWTTWLTAATDARVIAAVPIVMDLLHLKKSIGHMWQAYGGWTFAFVDYYDLNITNYLESPLLDPLADIIDPINYKENLTMPKLVVDATGDEFFMLDNDHYWWGDLLGETYRLMIANAEHTCATGLLPLVTGVSSFMNSIVLNSTRPTFTWTMDPTTGQITVDGTGMRPTKAEMWSATTESTLDNGRRDFRLIKGDTKADPCEFIKVSVFGEACVNPVIWVPEPLEISTVGDNNYQVIATQDLPPPTYWRGFLIYLYFPGPAEGQQFLMTTQVSIIPHTFPFKACPGGAACHGVLV